MSESVFGAMKSIINISIFVFIISSHTLMGSELYGMDTILPKVEFKEEDAKAAFEAISKMASAEGAEKQGFRGLVIDPDLQLEGKKVEISYSKAPFLEVLKFITRQCACSFYVNKGVVHINKIREDWYPLYLSPMIASKFKLGDVQSIDEERVLQGLGSVGVSVNPETIRIVPGKVILVQVRSEDVAFLDSLIILFERGYAVSKSGE